MKKKSILILLFAAYLAVGCVGMYFGGTQTMGDLCGVSAFEKSLYIPI